LPSDLLKQPGSEHGTHGHNTTPLGEERQGVILECPREGLKLGRARQGPGEGLLEAIALVPRQLLYITAEQVQKHLGL
jgi:hypothetical protein